MRIPSLPNKGKPQPLRGAAPSGDRVLTDTISLQHRGELVSVRTLSLDGAAPSFAPGRTCSRRKT